MCWIDLNIPLHFPPKSNSIRKWGNEEYYNPDVLSIKGKTEILSSIWDNLDVTECNPKINEFSEIKNKQETAKIIRFPA